MIPSFVVIFSRSESVAGYRALGVVHVLIDLSLLRELMLASSSQPAAKSVVRLCVSNQVVPKGSSLSPSDFRSSFLLFFLSGF